MLIWIGDRLCSHLHLFKRVSVVCAQVCVPCYPSFPRDAHTLQRVPPHTSRLLISQPKIPDCLGHTIQIGEIRKQQLRAPRIQGMPLESICFMLRWHGEGGQGDEHIFRFFFSFFLNNWHNPLQTTATYCALGGPHTKTKACINYC